MEEESPLSGLLFQVRRGGCAGWGIDAQGGSAACPLSSLSLALANS
jgi:hypothetical protein